MYKKNIIKKQNKKTYNKNMKKFSKPDLNFNSIENNILKIF